MMKTMKSWTGSPKHATARFKGWSDDGQKQFQDWKIAIQGKKIEYKKWERAYRETVALVGKKKGRKCKQAKVIYQPDVAIVYELEI